MDFPGSAFPGPQSASALRLAPFRLESDRTRD